VLAYLGPLRQSPQRNYLWTSSIPQVIEPSGKNAVEALIASAVMHSHNIDLLEHVEYWLIELGLVSKFGVEPIDRDKRYYETRVKIGDAKMENSLLDVGFGVSQILPVLTMLFFVPEGSVVLIEQPELHLHPSAQAHLADLFLHVAETRNLQLIVESHSEHLLRRFQRRIAEAQFTFATSQNVKAYFCKLEAGESQIDGVEVDEYGQIRNWPDNFFGDLGGDLDAMMNAALERRRQELSEGG
jgi:predicted ATPase